MKYQFVTEKENYEDLAAGRVILTKTGATSFPVRLASEIFQRCAEYFPKNQRLRVYDPCCGAGYLLTVIGFLHHTRLSALWGSDIDYESLVFAADNLSLLSANGLKLRQIKIQQMFARYKKDSHQEALNSIQHLKQSLPEESLSCQIWRADAMQPSLAKDSVDILITDVPYGNLASWQGIVSEAPIHQLLEAQYPVLVSGAIVAIISDEKQKTAPPTYQRLFRDKLGKRYITLYQKI